jgi:hypothetical protein
MSKLDILLIKKLIEQEFPQVPFDAQAAAKLYEKVALITTSTASQHSGVDHINQASAEVYKYLKTCVCAILQEMLGDLLLTGTNTTSVDSYGNIWLHFRRSKIEHIRKANKYLQSSNSVNSELKEITIGPHPFYLANYTFDRQEDYSRYTLCIKESIVRLSRGRSGSPCSLWLFLEAFKNEHIKVEKLLQYYNTHAANIESPMAKSQSPDRRLVFNTLELLGTLPCVPDVATSIKYTPFKDIRGYYYSPVLAEEGTLANAYATAQTQDYARQTHSDVCRWIIEEVLTSNDRN